MSSNLLKCVRYQAHFSENIIFNQRRKLSNLKTLHQCGPLYVETRNILSPSRGTVEENKNVFKTVANKSGNMIDQIMRQRSIRKAEIEDVLNKVQTEDDIDASDALVLLKCCNNVFDGLPSMRLKFVQYVWSHLSLCNVPLGVHHYNERLKLYIKYDHDFAPMDILKEMKANNVCPDTTTYHQCIKYYCRKGKIKCTSPFLTELSNQNILMTENIYNSLIWGYYLNGEMTIAQEIFGTQIENAVHKNETYTIQMCIAAEENKFDKIKEILEHCNLHDIILSNKDILNVIYRLAVNNHTKHIDEIISRLRKILPPSGDEIHIILKFIYINRVDIAIKIILCFKDMYVSKLFIENLVYYSTDVYTIINVCNILDKNNLCKNSLFWALYYSYFRDNDLCFSLLKIYERDHKIKPHFFWPMLTRKSNMYDVKGLLNVIKIMLNDFNVSPCISTLSNYVMPYLFGNTLDSTKLLETCGVCKTIINNAVVVGYLKELKTQNALYYATAHKGPYLYNYIVPELKKALANSEDTRSLIYLTKFLKDSNYENENIAYSKEATKARTCLPIDKLLSEIMDDNLLTKIRLKKVLTYLSDGRINVKPETISRLHHYIGLRLVDTVQNTHESMSRKWDKYRSSNINKCIKEYTLNNIRDWN